MGKQRLAWRREWGLSQQAHGADLNMGPTQPLGCRNKRFFSKKKILFIYLAALGLSCGTWDL